LLRAYPLSRNRVYPAVASQWTPVNMSQYISALVTFGNQSVGNIRTSSMLETTGRQSMKQHSQGLSLYTSEIRINTDRVLMKDEDIILPLVKCFASPHSHGELVAVAPPPLLVELPLCSKAHFLQERGTSFIRQASLTNSMQLSPS
jgi:hypothetical protein